MTAVEEGAGLEVRDIHVRYGRVSILGNVSLPLLRAGRITAFAGPNGAGKSTLLRAIAGMVRAGGAACFEGQDLMRMPARQRGRILGFMPQGLDGASGLTVLESIIASLRVFSPGLPVETCRHRALGVLEEVGLLQLAMRRLNTLSGGQRQLASLAQSLVRQPRILLLDEPTSALDLRHQIEVMSILRRVARNGCMVLVVLHDLALVANWADEVVFLHEGAVAAAGVPAEVMTDDLLARIYGVQAQVSHGPEGGSFVLVKGLARKL
ncbi:ABC transporter ATP-binding protein [Xanthobacter sp. TB0136]|uniref:ABC transporter ATP-binding protein n=1 Tax=Xanthobacter sp. TB0136 TaxID=3459177 RepID=UPI00403A04A6